MRRKLRPRTLVEISRWRVRSALYLTRCFWHRRAHPYIQWIRQPPDERRVNQADCYANLRLAALRATCRFRHYIHHDHERYVWDALRNAFIKELRAASWWLTDDDVRRLRAHHVAGTTPTADLLVPRSFSEVIDPTPDLLTHLIDDLPDRYALSLHEEVCDQVQVRQIHSLLARLPHKYRGPVWAVYAEGLDFYSASRELSLPVRVCWERANEGLARLKAAVDRDPSCLLPPG